MHTYIPATLMPTKIAGDDLTTPNYFYSSGCGSPPSTAPTEPPAKLDITL